MRRVRPCALASVASAKTEIKSASARRILKRHLWQFTLTRSGLEELELAIPHRPGDEVRRNRRDRGVEIAHDGIVVPAGVLDSLFYGCELRLEIAESAGGLELRI